MGNANKMTLNKTLNETLRKNTEKLLGSAAGLKGVLLALFSAFGFSWLPVLAKLAYSEELSLLQVLAVRFGLAAVIFWLIIFLVKEQFKVSFSTLLKLALLSLLGYGIGSTCLFWSYQLIPAALATMVLYTYPLLVALLETLWGYNQFSPVRVIALILATVGLCLVLGNWSGGGNWQGVMLAAISALAYAFYLFLGRVFTLTTSSLTVTAYLLLLAALGFGCAALAVEGPVLFNISGKGWGLCLIMAVISTVLPVLCLFTSLKYIDAARVAVVSTVEPFSSIILVLIFFHEPVMLWQLGGGLLILLAVLLAAKN